jgi:hypothetical protein
MELSGADSGVPAAVSAQGISLVTSSGGPVELGRAARLAQDPAFLGEEGVRVAVEAFQQP